MNLKLKYSARPHLDLSANKDETRRSLHNRYTPFRLQKFGVLRRALSIHEYAQYEYVINAIRNIALIGCSSPHHGSAYS
jgi:hypothetical protein